MAQSISELARHVAATANRLRLIQIDFADHTPEARREHLAEQIKHSLEQIGPEQRGQFLQLLRERFPTWDAEERAPEMTPTGTQELQDPSFLVEKLIEISAGLPAEQKRVLVQRLREAGLSATGEMGLSPGSVEELRQRLRIRPEQAIDPDRLVELTRHLLDFCLNMDQLSWKIWRTVNPRSSLRNNTTLGATLGQFVAGGEEVNRAQVTQDLEKLRQVTAALVAAVNRASRQFAQNFVARYHPTEIESSVRMEGGSFLTSLDVKCWRKYRELAETMDVESIDSEIMQALARTAEDLMGV